MARLDLTVPVIGPWSLGTSRRFWEGSTPAALTGEPGGEQLRTTFRVDQDWSRAEVTVTRSGADAQLSLTGRRTEYLHAVADAALEGRLDGAALRAQDPDEARREVQQITGLGPFAADLVVLRGANTPDGLPRHERRLDDEVRQRYGPHATLDETAANWRPYRTWAAVLLRALRERRTQEIGGAGDRPISALAGEGAVRPRRSCRRCRRPPGAADPTGRPG